MNMMPLATLLQLFQQQQRGGGSRPPMMQEPVPQIQPPTMPAPPTTPMQSENFPGFAGNVGPGKLDRLLQILQEIGPGMMQQDQDRRARLRDLAYRGISIGQMPVQPPAQVGATSLPPVVSLWR